MEQECNEKEREKKGERGRDRERERERERERMKIHPAITNLDVLKRTEEVRGRRQGQARSGFTDHHRPILSGDEGRRRGFIAKQLVVILPP